MLRKQNNISLRKLSEDIGYSKSIIGYWESNKIQPTIVALKKICDYFNVSADYMLGRSERE